MAKKKAVKKKKVAPKVNLEEKLVKLEEYLKTQVDIINKGGDAFTDYPEL